MAEVKLLGSWASPFSCRVIWALKLKGVAFEYVEEDFLNKSDLLSQYNPIYKKVPVLVHAGKPICQPNIIDEYIEETWPQNPMLPVDPYDRYVARFWIKYAQEKAMAIHDNFLSPIQELEKAAKDLCEMLEGVEKRGLLGEKKYFNGDKIGLVDTTFASVIFLLQSIECAMDMKLFESHRFPGVYEWFENFKQVPTIKEKLPNHDEIARLAKQTREKFTTSS